MNTHCDGCGGHVTDVGPLTTYTVTLLDGATVPSDYCADCAEIAALGVQHPGESYGAAALPTFRAVVPVGARA